MMRAIVFLLILVVFGLSVTASYQIVDARQQRAEIRENAAQAKAAICALQDNFRARIKSTQTFLKENPDTPRFAVVVLKQSVANSQATLKALSHVEC